MPATSDAPVFEDPAATRSFDSRADGDLLRLYGGGDEAAFEELVSRHHRWVYASAFRQLRDAADAQDVSQAVFVALARKAGALQGHRSVAPWLFRAARYAIIDMIRAKSRRSKREQMAFAESAPETESERWQQLEPVVDECLAQLGPKDQTAILLRYYEQKGWREIGRALGLKENTARVRAERALVKLRNILRRRGVHETVAGLAVTLFAHAARSASLPAFSTTHSNTVATLAHAISRRFLIQKAVVIVAVAMVIGMLGVTIESFRRLPAAQDQPLQILIGEPAVAALRDLDDAFLRGNFGVFIDRIHFRNEADLRYRDGLGDYLMAVAEFRSAGARRFRNPMFGYYATLDELFVNREKPTLFERHARKATGIFARNRGIHLIESGDRWKWDFFDGFSEAQWQERFRILNRKSERLRMLTERIKDDAPVSQAEIIDAFRAR